jgi:2-polyprenyl-3-methyl-5-hydroxy-6-metoxy-1,4-benzoquinol methylase
MDFNYQWKNLPSPDLEYTEKRIAELVDHTGLTDVFFQGKYCLDAGCGTGRWTWAMIQMGAHSVDSFDISKEAVAVCKRINPSAYVMDLMTLQPTEKYDFVLCWGVLHHLEIPMEGFRKIATQVKRGGFLHVMVYHKDTQKVYEHGRRLWRTLSDGEKLSLCQKYAMVKGGTVHGWWDAFNPQYNWSYHQNDVKKWFKETGFKDIRLVKKYNINLIGRKK